MMRFAYINPHVGVAAYLWHQARGKGWVVVLYAGDMMVKRRYTRRVTVARRLAREWVGL